MNQATIESEIDPHRAARTGYRITGRDRASVQLAIDTLMTDAEDYGGQASFIGPVSINLGGQWVWRALGEVVRA